MTMTKKLTSRGDKPPQKPRQEPGYRAVLCHETTKARLSDVRSQLQDKDLCQERRLVTAALDLVIDKAEADPDFKKKWIAKTHGVVATDMEIQAGSM